MTTLPLLLVILTGILFSTLLLETGSLARIVDWLKTGARNALARNLLITFGVGNFMEGAGVIAEPVVGPMLLAAGVPAVGSAALSVIGYAGLMTLELAGVIITVLALVTGLPVYRLSLDAAWLSIPAVALMALAAPFFLPGQGERSRALAASLAVGLLLGFAALGAVALGATSVSGTLGGLAVILTVIIFGSGRLNFRGGIWADLAPFLFLILALFSVNAVPPLREIVFERLALKIRVTPIHAVTLRPLFSAYLYILIAFWIATRQQRIGRDRLGKIFRTAGLKGWRAFAAMGLFGAMGQIISFTGYGPGFENLDQARNIPWIISQGLVQGAGDFYPVFVPFLGWVGTFLTGYGVASLMLFGKLQVEAAALLGTSPAWLAAGLAVGSSIGSISSPFKIALASPMVGAAGKEGQILRVTIPLGIGVSLAVGVVVWLFS